MGIKTRVTSPDNFSKTFSYEAFMKRAFNVSDNQRLYVNRSNMENLLAAEIRRIEQLEKVKEYLNMALDKLIKQNEANSDLERLKLLKIRIADASYSNDLVHVINEALAITQEWQEFQPS